MQISPGTSALITAETIASLPPVLPISDCEGEAYQECQREMWRLEAERAAEHAASCPCCLLLVLAIFKACFGTMRTCGLSCSRSRQHPDSLICGAKSGPCRDSWHAQGSQGVLGYLPQRPNAAADLEFEHTCAPDFPGNMIMKDPSTATLRKRNLEA
eukprot:scaffold63529_cov25-Tisochrysis_lutea.AAC.1